MRRAFSSIAVFCGSNFGASPVYGEGAAALGKAMAAAGVTLVYGGSAKGLMGIVADAILDAGGSAHGIITESLHLRGHSHQRLTTQEITGTLRMRKSRMAELADAFIALPGGIGTLEEFMEVWTMNQLGELDKPVGLLNIAGFFEPFLSFIERMVQEKFLPASHRHSIAIDADPVLLIEKMRSFEHTMEPKWL